VGQGQPFRLMDWQKRFIRDVYEPHGVNGKRLVRRAVLSVGRKNGKTALIAALALAHLFGPEQVQNGEIYSCANDREQASLVYKTAAQIVRADPDLSAALRCVDSTKTIANYTNGSFYRAVSAESGTKHGFNPTLVIYDELAQSKTRDLYDVLDTSMGAREEPLFITISTQSNDPEHILSKLIDDGLNANDPTIVCHLYAVPDEIPDEDLFREETWYQANPALGVFRSLEDLRAVADKAKRMPAEEPKFRNLFLNQRVSPTASLISRAEWMACQGNADFTPGERVYLGLDLSSVNDLSALVMVSADNGTRVKPYLWKPEEHLREHSNRDFGTGNHRYVEWADAGHLLTTPGRSIKNEVIALKIAEIYGAYSVLGLAYDRWRIDDLLNVFDRLDFPAYRDGEKGAGLRLVPWGAGYQSMSPAIDALEFAVIERQLIHPGNPVFTWNIANAVATMDPAGNRKLDKDKARFRIDGAVALAMAVGLKSRDQAAAPIDVMAFIG
jgi:phage terminase large subunit-like protein